MTARLSVESASGESAADRTGKDMTDAGIAAPNQSADAQADLPEIPAATAVVARAWVFPGGWKLQTPETFGNPERAGGPWRYERDKGI